MFETWNSNTIKKIAGAVPKYNTTLVQTGKIDTSNNTWPLTYLSRGLKACRFQSSFFQSLES